MTPDPTTILTSVGMIAQFVMLWIAWELRKGRKVLEAQNRMKREELTYLDLKLSATERLELESRRKREGRR